MHIPESIWRRLLLDLAERGHGRRESGAFLLARRVERPRHVVDYALFDDLDPNALNGAIAIGPGAFSRLWTACRARGLHVVADVHTHPGPAVHQSRTDQRNPMIALAGHIAIILPRFAQGEPRRNQAGVHVYRGDRTWISHYGEHAAALLAKD